MNATAGVISASASSKDDYYWAIVNDEGTIRALTRTETEAAEFAGVLIAANGGTAHVKHRSDINTTATAGSTRGEPPRADAAGLPA